ncbi:hypothetical protein EPUS_05034 [Endocarpon pusillum Z07020]|uniref:Uncharacterized protein n=1 Tax=Endocarpon pusillum (strain Z07020 / HMAS-L-300199) TaxID=1263415 RepID=U1GL57_ENDPU|nr:uncharacterized protein EPUS_05034 [Endocarpon pusillum Z07020]ERF72953.1 hypothetical protein EPUS_05034 [Endocarpon pusillum Z07020]
MDSMRSLNTSLPTSRSRRSQAPELLQAFKSAALSVTNLYKTTVTDQANTRHLGYQDALDDLLSFLDRENLGLQDGEGWRIRQWATERFEGGDTTGCSIDSDDDRTEIEKRARSSSPMTQSRPAHEGLEVRGHASSDSNAPRTESAPPPIRKEESHSPVMDRPSMFTFSAAHPLPNRDVQMQTSDTSSSDLHLPNDPPSEATPSQSPGSLRVEIVNRAARMQNRHNSTRHNTRSTNRDTSFAGGTKRKLNLPEFFDISNMGNSRDGTNGGGKRGRFV